MSETFGTRLQRLRSNTHLSLDEVAIRLRLAGLPAQVCISAAKLRRWEHDQVGARNPDPVLVAVLARFYGVSHTELSPETVEAIGIVRGLIREVLDPEHHAVVAEIVLECLEDGSATPNEDVAEAFDVPAVVAERWVREAFDRRLVTATVSDPASDETDDQ